eukprot:maker-scaffold_9-snap-gene-12.49-mRNA-1 protein AED:0.14 eAED:0.14 QI:0/0/0/0.8/1/1/5/0/653
MVYTIISNKTRNLIRGLNLIHLQYNTVSTKAISCGKINKKHVGQDVILKGWLESSRVLGKENAKRFATIRDETGLVQISWSDKQSHIDKIPLESVVEVSGKVSKRPQQMKNLTMSTGEVEILVDDTKILNNSISPLPVKISKRLERSDIQMQTTTDVETRLKYRYYDLRNPIMQQNIRIRSAVMLEARNFLAFQEDFVEVDTPTLFKSTPEGAREFLVPVDPPSKGKEKEETVAYALTQSPQQYKQMLMASGFSKYFQIARCYRCESGRSDRQPEFVQIDLEMAYASQEKLQKLIEKLISKIFSSAKRSAIKTGEKYGIPRAGDDLDNWLQQILPKSLMKKISFEKITYDKAMRSYGSDKPDLRTKLRINTLDFENCGKEVAYLKIPKLKEKIKISRKFFENWINTLGQRNGTFCGFGVAHFVNGQPKLFLSSSISELTQLKDKQLLRKQLQTAQIKENDIIFFAENISSLMGQVVSQYSEYYLEKNHTLRFLWVEEFPMFEFNSTTEGLQSVHHPFTRVSLEQNSIFEKLLSSNINKDIKHRERLLSLKSQSFDLVCNGMELGGGSIRIHEPDIQKKVFKRVLDMSDENIEDSFGHLLDALSSGAPPHGGFAIGLDRLLTLICSTDTIIDVIPFPKTLTGRDPLSGAPTKIK